VSVEVGKYSADARVGVVEEGLERSFVFDEWRRISMGVWFETKYVVLVEGVHFNGVKFAILGFQRAGLFVPSLEVVSFRFSVQD
jgi:hypothetical protein